MYWVEHLVVKVFINVKYLGFLCFVFKQDLREL